MRKDMKATLDLYNLIKSHQNINTQKSANHNENTLILNFHSYYIINKSVKW